MALQDYYKCSKTKFEFDFIETNGIASIYKAYSGDQYRFYIVVTNDTKQFPYLTVKFTIPTLDGARRYLKTVKHKPNK